ncbi:CMP deaminase [Candidatus Wolfebacteria bacterium]|nr:CMP deaminase [Candidatus Wolfebacteria bacterium]
MSEKAPRLTFIEYGIFLAFGASLRATCNRCKVGCVLFDKNKRVIGTGYNGSPAGAPQCDEVGHLMVDGHCVGTTHSEKNGVLFIGNRSLFEDGYCFVTARPCINCFKLLVSQGVKHIYYLMDYRKEDNQDEIDRSCQEYKINLVKVNFNIEDLFRKAIAFHQASGGLLTNRYPLTIEERFPEGSE